MDEPAPVYRRADALADGALLDVTAAAFAAGLALPTAMTVEAHFWLGAADPGALARALREVVAALELAPGGGDLPLVLRDRGGRAVAACARLGRDGGGEVLTIPLEWER